MMRQPQRAWLWAVVCSVWPLAVPAISFLGSIRALRRGISPEVLATLPEASRAGAVRLSSDIASAVTRIAAMFLLSMFVLSFLVCVVVLKRLSQGASRWRATAEIALIATFVGIMLILSSVIRGDLNLSLVNPRPTGSVTATLFPVWCLFAAGISFVLASRRNDLNDNAA
jgi:hypothetical protein